MTRPPAPPDVSDDAPPSAGHRSGFIAICGRPNVGKSTLLNALLGEAVAVATPHPQTTRERLLGIWTEPSFQAVLIDTPGIHRARSALNRFMVSAALRGARDVDVILLLAETPQVRDAEAAASWEPGEVAMSTLTTLAELGHPIVLVLTKIDRLADPALLLPILQTWSALHDFSAVIPVSALRGQGLDVLKNDIVQRLPEGPRYYEPEQLSDRNMRWHAAELVRAELFEHLAQELPYSCAVQVTGYEERPDRDVVRATVFVERDSQKGMVVGKGGRTIKAISSGARARIARLSGRPCELFLRVDVAKGWTRDPDKLGKLGYREDESDGGTRR